jgi:hypothetical protein
MLRPYIERANCVTARNGNASKPTRVHLNDPAAIANRTARFKFQPRKCA